MHTKRYNKLSLELCRKAVIECFRGKWRRNDVLTFIEKYAGIPRDDIKIEALSGEWTIRAEAVDSIALALLDIMLPGMDGFQLFTLMEKYNVPVIYMTAKTDSESEVRGRISADPFRRTVSSGLLQTCDTEPSSGIRRRASVRRRCGTHHG